MISTTQMTLASQKGGDFKWREVCRRWGWSVGRYPGNSHWHLRWTKLWPVNLSIFLGENWCWSPHGLLRWIFWWKAPKNPAANRGHPFFKVMKSSMSAESWTQRLLDARVEIWRTWPSAIISWKKTIQNAKNRECYATGRCFFSYIARWAVCSQVPLFVFFERHRTCWRVSYWLILESCRFTYQEYDSWLQHWIGLDLNLLGRLK